MAAPGATALAIDGGGSQLVIGYEDGRLATIDLGLLGEGGVDLGLQPTPVLTLDHPIQHLFVSEDGAYVVAASSDRATTIDLADATATGSVELPDIVDLATGGSGSAIVANVDEVTDHAAAAATLSDALKSSAADDYQAQLDAASPGTTIVLDEPPASGDTRNALDAAIADRQAARHLGRDRQPRGGRDERRRRLHRPGARHAHHDDPARGRRARAGDR